MRVLEENNDYILAFPHAMYNKSSMLPKKDWMGELIDKLHLF